MRMLLNLFLTFAKIGLFTFGGGFAMISVIDDSCVEKKHWITNEELIDMTVIAESTPGPVAINCATFVGHKQKGFLGAVAATFGMVLPSFVIIYLISLFLDNFIEIAFVSGAFKGIKIAVGILVLDAGIKMLKRTQKKPVPMTILCSAFVAMLLINIFSWNFSTISLMIIAAAVSLVVFGLQESLGKGGASK